MNYLSKLLVRRGFVVLMVIVVSFIVSPLTPVLSQGEINHIYASYETVQTYFSDQEEVSNDPVDGTLIINTDLHNPGEDNGSSIVGENDNGGPTLNLATSPDKVIQVENEEFFVPDSEYTWEFAPIAPYEGQRGAVQLDANGLSTFTLGFTASRSVADGIISPTGGECTVEINATPIDTIDRLVIVGEMRVSEQISTHISDLVVLEDDTQVPEPGEGIHWGYDDNHFELWVEDPISSYKLVITAAIEPFDPSLGEIDYAPFVQVRNIDIISSGQQDSEDSMFSHEATASLGVNPLGTWNWQASGDYSCDWEIKEVKEVNFEGRPHDEDTSWDYDNLRFETQNFFSYEPEGDMFLNNLVNGSMFWMAGNRNLYWETYRVIDELGIDLVIPGDTGDTMEVNWNQVYIYEETAPQFTGGQVSVDPYAFSWTATNTEPTQGTSIIVSPIDPNDAPIDYEPGFDAYRWVDSSEFLFVDGSQTQTLTVVVTPREGFLQNHENNGIVIYVAVGENQLISGWEGSNFANIISISNPNSFMSTDGHLGAVGLTDWGDGGIPITTQIEIQVEPDTDISSFVPTIWVFEVVEYIDDTYGEEYTHNFRDSISESIEGPPYVFSIDQPQLGTWTWSVDMEGDPPFITMRENVLLKGITFSENTPTIDTFNIGSMSINFGEDVGEDEIIIPEAKFSLSNGNIFNSDEDDVRMIIDGVEIMIPAGSFNQIGGPLSEQYIYNYNSKGPDSTRIQVVIDFDTGIINLIAKNIDASIVDNSDGVSVIFAFGENAAIEVINMKIGGLSYSAPGY